MPSAWGGGQGQGVRHRRQLQIDLAGPPQGQVTGLLRQIEQGIHPTLTGFNGSGQAGQAQGKPTLARHTQARAETGRRANGGFTQGEI